jgi:putative oxidoreductase
MLSRLLAPRIESAYALLRVLAGAMFAFHGLQKVFGVLADGVPAPGTQLWIGGVIELATGCAMAIGAFTTWAAFLASGTMAVAYVQFHWKGDLDERILPGVNRGELALVYALLFLFVACRGGGRWSLDGWLHRRRPQGTGR